MTKQIKNSIVLHPLAQDTAAPYMCFEMIRAQELVLGSRGVLPCRVGLSPMYNACHGTAAPTPDSGENHGFWGTVQTVKERTDYFHP